MFALALGLDGALGERFCERAERQLWRKAADSHKILVSLTDGGSSDLSRLL